MCLAIYKPAGSVVGRKRLFHGFDNNPDGAGFGFVNDEGDLMYQKGFFKFEDFIKAYRENVHDHTPAVIHFRWATVGGKTSANCHPFPTDSGLLLIHNGPQIQQLRDAANDRSDSRVFAEDIISKMDKQQLINSMALIEGYLQHNKVAILCPDGDAIIFNARAGHWDNGVWFSNDGYKQKAWKKARKSQPAPAAGASNWKGTPTGPAHHGGYPNSSGYPDFSRFGDRARAGASCYGGLDDYDGLDDDFYPRPAYPAVQSRYSDASQANAELAERFTQRFSHLSVDERVEARQKETEAARREAESKPSQVVMDLAERRQRAQREERDERITKAKGGVLAVLPPTEAELIRLVGPDAAEYVKQYVEVDDWIYEPGPNLFFFKDFSIGDYIDVESGETYDEYMLKYEAQWEEDDNTDMVGIGPPLFSTAAKLQLACLLPSVSTGKPRLKLKDLRKAKALSVYRNMPALSAPESLQ